MAPAFEREWRTAELLGPSGGYDVAGRPRRAFRYFDRGKLAVIGRGHAVCEMGPLRLAGLPAWLIWAFVHVMFLIGFRNRVVAMLEWARTYFVQHRGGRFIIGDR